MDVVTYALARKYVDQSLVGGGALKGKNCTIQSIEDITGGKRVTFRWILDDGTIQTGHMDVFNGQDGQDGAQGPQGIQGPAGVDLNSMEIKTIDGVSHLVVTYSDAPTTEIDCGAIVSNGEGKVHRDEQDWEPIEFTINSIGGTTNFTPQNRERKIEIEEIDTLMNVPDTYIKIITPPNQGSATPPQNYVITLENNHLYYKWVYDADTAPYFSDEIIEGDGQEHDYTSIQPLIIDLTETFGVDKEPIIDFCRKMVGAYTWTKNKTTVLENYTGSGWVSSNFSTDRDYMDYAIFGKTADGEIYTVENWNGKYIDGYIYPSGFYNGEEVDWKANFKEKTLTVLNSEWGEYNYFLSYDAMTPTNISNNFVYIEDGSKHYLISKFNYISFEHDENYNPTTHPNKNPYMRCYKDRDLYFDSISTNELLNAETMTSDSNLNNFAFVNKIQFPSLSWMTSETYAGYAIWRYDDCNSINDFFLKWNFDLSDYDGIRPPALTLVITPVIYAEEDRTIESLDRSWGDYCMPDRFIITLKPNTIDLYFVEIIENSNYTTSMTWVSIKIKGKELKPLAKISVEDATDSNIKYLEKCNPIALGYKITLGSNSNTNDYYYTLAGLGGTTKGSNSIAIGNFTESEFASIAMGYQAKALHPGAIVLGYNCKTENKGSIAIGVSCTAGGTAVSDDSCGGIAIGRSTEGRGSYSVGIGHTVRANGEQSIAIGRNAQATGVSCVVIGSGASIAIASSSVAVGYEAKITGGQGNGIAIGNIAQVNETNSIAIGAGSKSFGQNATAVGQSTNVFSTGSTALGAGAYVGTNSAFSTSVGADARIDNGSSECIAIGRKVKIKSNNSNIIAIGSNINQDLAWTIGADAVMIGNFTSSAAIVGSRAIAIGKSNSVTAEDTISIGYSTEAKGARSICIGASAKTSSTDCVAAIAIGENSHAYGDRAIAIGTSTTEATGNKACAIGYGVKANGTNYTGQVALGVYNVEDSTNKYALIFGNGTADNARSNLFTVDKDGVIEAGNLPAPPTTAGSYVLTATVTVVDNELVTAYNWESTTI